MARRTIALILLLAVACTASRVPPEDATTRSSPRSVAAPSVAPSLTPAASAGPSILGSWGIAPIDAQLRRELTGRNWHPGCPVALGALRIVTVRYHAFDGTVRSGPLVLNERVAADVLWVFRRLFRAGFPIKHVALARKYRPRRPSDYERRRDVTASFNCRPVTDGTTLSQHSYGWAIDINPLQNPYVRGDGTVLRRAAKPCRNRSHDLPGMIHPGDVVVRSFARIGWSWGGDWSTLKDYMHFSLTGR